jgi:hypothetical protein
MVQQGSLSRCPCDRAYTHARAHFPSLKGGLEADSDSVAYANLIVPIEAVLDARPGELHVCFRCCTDPCLVSLAATGGVGAILQAH